MSIVRPVLVLCTTAFFVSACSGELDRPRRRQRHRPRPTRGGVEVDAVEIVHGVPDHGRDPAVVAIDVGGEGLCTGTLIAPDVVLTARHCVSVTSEGAVPAAAARRSGAIARPRRSASSSATTRRLGDARRARPRARRAQEQHALRSRHRRHRARPRRRGRRLPVSSQDRRPARPLRARGGLRQDRATPISAAIKLLRDHVKIQEVSTAEFLVGEATCNGDSGGPALDESTGELVGVVSRGGPAAKAPACTTSTRAPTRSRTSSPRPSRRAARATPSPTRASSRPHRRTRARRPSPTKPASDMGDTCAKGSDCSAGVCVKDSGKPYCSRTCGTRRSLPQRLPLHAGHGRRRTVCIAAASDGRETR